MDTLELRHIDLAFGKKVKAPNIAVHQYVEFFVNDEPLSDIINRFFKLSDPLLAKFTSTLGTMESTNSDRLKVIQLLGKRPAKSELDELFPAKHFDQEPILQELQMNQVLIYCCAECGDYKCGGFFARITKEKDSYTWHFDQYGKQILKFEFPAAEYEAVLQDYVAELEN